MPYPAPRVDPIDQPMLDEIGADLRHRRVEAWLTQRDLERLTGVDQTTISRVENGLIPTLRLHRYARLLAGVAGRFGRVEHQPRRRPRQRTDW